MISYFCKLHFVIFLDNCPTFIFTETVIKALLIIV